MKQKLGRFLSLAAISSAAALALVAPAQAAVYTGSWDPAFGAPFSNLGWRVTADLFVPDACAAAVGTQTVNNQPHNPPSSSNFANVSNCSGLSVNNTTLYFYDINDLFKTTVESFAIGTYGTTTNPASNATTEDQVLTSVEFNAGVPVDFDTSASLRVVPTSPAGMALAGGGSFGFSLSLSLDPAKVRLWYVGVDNELSEAVRNGQYSRIEPQISFRLVNQVPEPGSLALALTALLAAGAAARRSPR